MTKRWRYAAVSLGLALLSAPATAAPGAAPRATTVPKAIVAPRSAAAESAHDLYSARARRLVRTYLQLRMLELREADLERVRTVITGRMNVDALFPSPPAQAGDRGQGR
jgi:hypothetical protein